MAKLSTEINSKVKQAKSLAGKQDFTTAAMLMREAAALYDLQAAELNAAARKAASEE